MKEWRIPDDYLEQGCFVVPHFIFSEDAALDKHERLFLTMLFACEDRYLPHRKGKWFFVSNPSANKRSGISERQVPRIRDRVCLKRLIEFKRGRTGRATDYRIRLDPFYRQWRTQSAKPTTHKKSVVRVSGKGKQSTGSG
jgi:hypothetical protein